MMLPMMNTTATPETLFAEIQAHLSSSKKARVIIATMTRAWAYKHADMFRVNSRGELQAQNGRQWNTIAEPALGPVVSIRFTA